MRIIFVPQFPSIMRYQEWWLTEFPKEFEKSGYEVLVLGKDIADKMKSRSSLEMFSPINQSIEFEMEQVKEYMLLELRDDDILFLADLSFPGFFCNTLYHKRCAKMYAFCHATSLNKFDYFGKVRNYKFPVEYAQARMFNKVFVGSEYHADKIKFSNAVVTYLPFPPLKPSTIKEKKYDIISVSRPTPQKVNLHLEQIVSDKFGKINRPISNTWEEYFDNLAMSKILLITSYEDTFGYQIVDAIMNGCIPIAREDCAYPELLSDEYLYGNDNVKELLRRVGYFLKDENYQVPKLLCREQMNKFYKKIIDEIEVKENSFF